MIPFKDIKTIFFDYDGTLHDSLCIYVPAFRKAYEWLVQEGYAEQREWSAEEISYWLGFNPEDMWENFMPDLNADAKQKCSNIIGEEMKHFIENNTPVLYEGALDTLSYLKNKGYHLIFISNCKIYYKKLHTSLFSLDQFFDSMVCSEEYNHIPKHEIINIIKNNFPKEMVIVGDRFQDMEAGKNNNIYTIGCRYGYSQEGELDQSDLSIDHILQLKHYF